MALPHNLSRALSPKTALVVCLALAATACSSSNERDNPLGLTKKEYLDLYLENAFRYIELGENDRAISQAAKALELDPDNEVFRLIFARGHLMRGEKESIQIAIDILDEMDDADDPNFRVLATFGAALERKGVIYDEASERVRSGEQPTEADDPIARADELRAEAIALWERAHSKYAQALEATSGTPEAINGLVRTSALLGNYEESIEHGYELIEAIQSSQRLVMTRLDQTDIDEASETRLFQAQRQNRGFEISTRLHISQLERRQGRLGKAVDQLDQIIALNPNMEQAYSRRAQLLEEMGEFRKAKESINRFIQIKAAVASFDDPSVQKAYELIERCNEGLRSRKTER